MAVPSTVVFHKYGSTSRPFTTSVAGTVFQYFYTRSKATSGSSYGVRFQHYLSGAGSGAAVRAYALAKAAQSGSMYGVEATAEINSATGSDVAGEMCAVKATAAVNLSTAATVNVLNLTINAASGKTMHANSAFICVANAGSGTDIANLFYFTDAIGTKSSATVVTTAGDTTSTHRIKVNAAGTDLWILATSDTPAD